MSMQLDDELLELFIVEKAAYEVCYELANRPDWVEVPLRGLLDTLEHGTTDEGSGV
jgi:maltose alpha-D-glucosyltransferase/alpha-amylase